MKHIKIMVNKYLAILFFIVTLLLLSCTHNTEKIKQQRIIDLKKAYNLAEQHKKEGEKLSKKHGVNVLIYDEFGNVKIKRNSKEIKVSKIED